MKRLFNFYYENPFKTMKELKGFFVSLNTYITLKAPPFFSRGKILDFYSTDVIWKDKYDSPRFEFEPRVQITLFSKFTLTITWKLPKHLQHLDIEDYWEQALWFLYYYDTISYGRLSKPDIEKAKESYPYLWINNFTKI